MVHYEVKDPNGVSHIIDGPEGATPDEIIAQAQKVIPIGNPEPSAPYQGTFLENASQAISGAMGKVAPLVEFGKKISNVVSPDSGLVGLAADKLGEAVDYGEGAIAEASGKTFPNLNPYVVPTALKGAELAAAYLAGPKKLNSLESNFELPPMKGKPSMAAQVRKMRTGVEASAFDQLRRDPGAFFSTASREELGKNIGAAKAAAGVNPGITSDLSTLTKENLNKARNPMGVSNAAQNTIADNIAAAKDLLGPGAEPKQLIELAGITPDQASTALDGVNIRLSKLERSVGRGAPEFQKWTAIKSHLQTILENVAPEVKQANKEFSRVALRDKFLHALPVNQNGTMSKINTFGFAPAAAGVGAMLGGAPGAAIGAVGELAYRSPFVAGLQTAARGYLDKAINPVLSTAVDASVRQAALAAFVDKITTKENSQ